MKKEMHSGLFGDGFLGSELRRPVVSEPTGAELSSLNSLNEVRRLEKRFESFVGEMKLRTDESNRLHHGRYEDFVKKISGMEAKFEALSQDLRSKYSHLSSKVTERNLSDLKTQALMDRHTQLLRQFESRVSQLQKVIEDQEFQLMNYKAALEDARKELAKLKRL